MFKFFFEGGLIVKTKVAISAVGIKTSNESSKKFKWLPKILAKINCKTSKESIFVMKIEAVE